MSEELLVGINKECVDFVWSHVAPFIERSIIKGNDDQSLRGIYEKILTGIYQLWIISDKGGKFIGTCVTRIAIRGNTKRIVIVQCAGIDFRKWEHLLKEMLDWAKQLGCTYMEVCGRPGWEKLLTKYGLKRKTVVMEAKI